MTEEEIININRKLKKMIDRSAVDESAARALLVRFQELDINLMTLQKTGIGKTVNELRRATANQDLSTMAKTLLKRWKNLLPAPFLATSSTKNDDKSIASTNNNSSQPQKEDSINKAQSQKASKMIEQNTYESITSVSNVPWQTTDKIRLKSRELLVNALTITGVPEGSSDPVELSALIEDAIFKEMNDTSIKYGRRIRSRIFNLRDLKNPDLRAKVLLGRITPQRLAVMTAEEMISDIMKEKCAKFKEITHRESLLAVDEGIGSDLIQCERCKERNCSYSELQTLSGDEPMTLFVLCRNCGYRWRG